MKGIPINPGESILDPLWDPATSGFPKGLWTVADGTAHGLRVRQNWCWLDFEWARKPVDGPALRMERTFDAECAAFDKLIVSVMPPTGAVTRLTCHTDVGPRSLVSEPAGMRKRELMIDLLGAKRIEKLIIEIDASADGLASGWINWVGLQNSATVESYQASLRDYDPAWPDMLRPSSEPLTFIPRYGIVVNESEMEAMRARHDAHLAAHGTSVFIQRAEIAMKIEPETLINDFVNFWGDTRYCRERDHGRDILSVPEHAISLAVAGLLTKNEAYLRKAARFALSINACTHWDDGFIARYAVSSWDHRCFVQSLCCYVIATVLDLAGPLFTDNGRATLLRRLADQGIAAINYNTWRFEYIFHCNQLAWFSPGRMLAYAVLEREMPRVKPYMEIAYQELVESLNMTVLPDGGYVEGPTYFRCVARDGGMALSYYARARGKSLFDVLPESVKRADLFAAALYSTDESTEVIPICDGNAVGELDVYAVMAAALPESQWTGIYRKALRRTDGLPSTLLSLRLDAQIPAASPAPPTIVQLPDMGIGATHRIWNGHPVKLFFMGNRAHAGHTHEDKGHFVLEAAGDTFAMDPGTADYALPLAKMVKNAEYHNMLVPTGTLQRPGPQNPLSVDVKPVIRVEADGVFASIDATPGWESYYTKWNRTWSSATPDRLVIADEYELCQGDGVDFLWITALPVTVHADRAVIAGRRASLTLRSNANGAIRVEELPIVRWDGKTWVSRTIRRIVIHHAGVKGRIEITGELESVV